MRSHHGTVLVGYDGTPDADIALRWAAETAALMGHSVRAVMGGRRGEPAGCAYRLGAR